MLNFKIKLLLGFFFVAILCSYINFICIKISSTSKIFRIMPHVTIQLYIIYFYSGFATCYPTLKRRRRTTYIIIIIAIQI